MLFDIIAADPTKSHVLEFCASITTETPVSILQSPPPSAQPLECFSNVANEVAKHGGQVVAGWAIWEWPGIYIEAEYHAVWQRPDGVLVDVTPRMEWLNGMTFVPDPTRPDDGSIRDNIRKALCVGRPVQDFFLAGKALFTLKTKGDGSGDFDPDNMTQTEEAIFKSAQRLSAMSMYLLSTRATPSDKCPCKSKRPYRKCCGTLADQLKAYVANTGR